MALGVSWWVLALAVGVTAPVWVRALVKRWDVRILDRTERLLAKLPPRGPSPS